MNLIKDIVNAQKSCIHLCPLLQMVSCQTESRLLIARIISKFEKGGKLGTAKVRLLHNSNAALALDVKGALKRRYTAFNTKLLKKERKTYPRPMPSWVTQMAKRMNKDTLSIGFIFLHYLTLHHCWAAPEFPLWSPNGAVTTGQISACVFLFWSFKPFRAGNMLWCITGNFHFINRLSIKMLTFHRYPSLIKARQLKKYFWNQMVKNTDHREVHFCLI